METGWIPFFEMGDYTNLGYGKLGLDFGEEVTKSYQPGAAAICIGHPRQNTPAYGRVSAIRQAGSRLEMKIKDINEKFVGAVKEKLFDRISPRFGRDPVSGKMTLKHVGFFGAYPVIQKHLPAVEFCEADFAEKENEAIYLAFDASEMKFSERGNEMETFSKEQIEFIQKNVNDGIAAALKPANADFAEKLGALEQTISELSRPAAPDGKAGDGKSLDFAEVEKLIGGLNTKLEAVGIVAAKAQEGLKRANLMDFCEQLIGQGKLLPAQKAAKVEFMLGLDEEKKLDFAEADGKKAKISQLEQYMKELGAGPKIGPDYREISAGAGMDFAEGDVEARYNSGRETFEMAGLSLEDFKKYGPKGGGAK